MIICPKCELNYIEENENECYLCKGEDIIDNSNTGSVSYNSVDIAEKALLIRINKTYRDNMSEQDMYYCTRGVWKVGARRESARYAFSVYKGVVMEVYKISYWEPATRYSKRLIEWDGKIEGRYQFVGKIDEAMNIKYKGKNVSSYFPQGSMSPVIYVNC